MTRVTQPSKSQSNDRLFFEIQKPLPQSLTNVTDFSKVIPTIETFFRVEDPPRRLIKMKL